MVSSLNAWSSDSSISAGKQARQRPFPSSPAILNKFTHLAGREIIPITTRQELLKVIHDRKDQKSLRPGITSNSMSSALRMVLRPPSAPISNRSKFFEAIRTSAVAVTAVAPVYGDDAGFEPNIGLGIPAQSHQTHVGELVLLGLDNEWKLCLVAQRS